MAAPWFVELAMVCVPLAAAAPVARSMRRSRRWRRAKATVLRDERLVGSGRLPVAFDVPGAGRVTATVPLGEARPPAAGSDVDIVYGPSDAWRAEFCTSPAFGAAMLVLSTLLLGVALRVVWR